MMKKGKKYRANIFKIKTFVHSGFIASTIGFLVLSLISLGDIINSVFSFCSQDSNKNLGTVGIVISALSFIVSIIGTIKSINALKHDCFHRQLLESKDYKSKIVSEVTKDVTADYRDNSYSWNEYDNEYYLYSNVVNEALYNESDKLLLNVSPKKRPLGKNQSEVLYSIVKNKLAQGKSIFNSNLVRLHTDMFVKTVLSGENNLQEIIRRRKNAEPFDKRFEFKDLKLIEVEKTDYFSNLTTNDQIYNRYFTYDYSSKYCGKDMTVDKTALLYNLSQSPAANIIGVNTLAITSDGYLIINVQNRNDVNNNTFVPSGSGSSDFFDLIGYRKSEKQKYKSKEGGETDLTLMDEQSKNRQLKDIISLYDNEIRDLRVDKSKIKEYLLLSEDKKKIKRYMRRMRKYTCDFKKFITYGMVRELVEESFICDPTDRKKTIETIIKYMDSTYICGFFRLLDRGGKPDFFGITFLDMSKEEVEDSFEKYRNKITQTELSKKCAITDFNEICSQITISIEEFNSNSIEELKRLLNKKIDALHELKVSLQLYYLFKILKDNKTILDKINKNISNVGN